MSDQFADTKYLHMAAQDVLGIRGEEKKQREEKARKEAEVVQIQMRMTEDGGWRLMKL